MGGQPAKLRQKDRDARWTVKYTKAKPSADGAPRVDLAVPAFGYKNHIGIDRRHRLIRRWTVTDAARHDGALLAELIDTNNTASEVWADTAYRSKANEKFLAGRLLRSQIHRKKPKGRPMPRRTARANARKSAVRSAVEHVFARQKGPMGLFIRTIGLARARTKVGLANLLYNHAAGGLAGCPDRTNLTQRSANEAGRAAPHHRPNPPTTAQPNARLFPARPPGFWRSPPGGFCRFVIR